MRTCTIGAAVFVVSFAATRAAFGADIFTEDFTNSSANWANFNSTAFLDYHATGGPDDGAYASGPRSFQNLTPGNVTVILRARHDNPWNSSGDAFKRNWNADGIRWVSAYVKHDFPEPLTYFLRAANPNGFPGGSYLATAPTPTDTWTKLLFNVYPDSPQLAGPDALEGSTWTDVFSDVGHLQFGVVIPSGHTSDSTAYTFSIDKVTISTPEPASVVLVVAGLVGFAAIIGRRFARRPRTGR